MKKNTLQKLLIQMRRPENYIEVDPETASKAKRAIEKMIELA
jgi:quinolinate synthase